ncbi:type VI lipase adapter Tla3 domain-containing protein [Burkholderia stagnalis]
MKPTFTAAARPRLLPYALVLAILAFAWMFYILFGSYQHWESTGLEVPNMGSTLRNGLFAIVGLIAAVFTVHWAMRTTPDASVAAPVPATTSSAQAVVSSPYANAGSAKMLAETGQKYALEIRGIGLAVAGRRQEGIWEQIEEKKDNYSTILSDDPKRYGENPDERRIFSTLATGSAFKYAASEAVDHWPLPVIIFGPPRDPQATYRSDYEIADARQNAGLGVTLFLTQDAQNTSSAAPAIAQLFEFFDKHPDVPAVLVMTQDGMQYRWAAKTPGTPSDPPGAFIPPVPDSMATLLVSRTDRVDHLVRPYAVTVTGDIDKDKTQYDVVKLWNFYWKLDEISQDERDAAAGGHFSGAYTMKTDWWISKLPELWKEATNKGPGDFKPSPYLPVRWANWQVEEFDEAPLLGYLHRPVNIKLTDSKGKPMRRAEQAQALQEGWKQAMATLPDGAKPNRVFYDTSSDRTWAIPLSQALHGNAEGIDLSEVKEGYDIGRRIGNTGVSSALVQVCLATIGSYRAGGASATVNLMDNGTASIVMVSPPDDASKAANLKHRGPDPLKYRSAG